MMARLLLVLALLAASAPAHAQRWVTSWAASAQGPYPSGDPPPEPSLRFAFAAGQAGARDQTFRLIITPSIWGNRVRIRLSNAFGAKPATFDGVFIGLQSSGASLMPRSNRPVTFGAKPSVTVPPGGQAWSDAVSLPWVTNPAAPELAGRKLAVSLHVAGESGPMTWHATSLQTSYVTPPGAGSLGELEDESAYPAGTTSWFFLDALDVQAADTGLVVCLGDSLTDGTNSTPNGDDRWPDVLARRLRLAGLAMAVANAGISGNQVVGPREYSAAKPFPGGPAALTRLDRDVLGLSAVTDVIWFEGINDFGADGGATAEQVEGGMTAGVKRIRDKFPGVKVVAATLPGTVGTANPRYAAPEVELKRRALNAWLRGPNKVFDGVIDFEAAVTDPATNGLRPEFVPGSTLAGAGDGLHPNRAGYLAMGDAIDLRLLRAPPARRPRPPPPPSPKPDTPEATE